MTASRAILTGILLLAFFGAPLIVDAQQPRPSRIGIVLQGGPISAAVDGLRAGLREVGLEEGRQVLLYVRDAKGDLKSVEAAARTLEEDKVDLIYAVTSSVALATKRATMHVPIVFYAATDPVALGLVESYRKPGGRLTGIHSQLTDLTAKRLELLKEMIPGLRKAVTSYSPDNPSAQQSVKIARDAARQLHVTLVERPVASVEALKAGLRALRPGEADAFLHVSDAMVSSQAAFIVDIARAKRLPTMLQFEEHARGAGGALASYGVNYHTVGRLSAKQVHRILQGAHPGDLPVE
jgi:ABC-type uncharacterized transport system substrate-binding protein